MEIRRSINDSLLSLLSRLDNGLKLSQCVLYHIIRYVHTYTSMRRLICVYYLNRTHGTIIQHFIMQLAMLGKLSIRLARFLSLLFELWPHEILSSPCPYARSRLTHNIHTSYGRRIDIFSMLNFLFIFIFWWRKNWTILTCFFFWIKKMFENLYRSFPNARKTCLFS